MQRTFISGKIGITLNVGWSEPFDKNNPDDLETSDRDINFNLGWFAHAIYVNGDYPEVMKKNVYDKSMKQGYKESRLPEFTFQEKIFINGNTSNNLNFGIHIFFAVSKLEFEKSMETCLRLKKRFIKRRRCLCAISVFLVYIRN